MSKPCTPVNIKIAGKWMFIPLKMVLIGIDPYPYYIYITILWMGFHPHWQRAPNLQNAQACFPATHCTKVRLPPMAKVFGYAKSATTARQELPGSKVSKGGHAQNVCKWLHTSYPTQPSARGLSWACKCCGTWKRWYLEAGWDSMCLQDLGWVQRWWIYTIYIYGDFPLQTKKLLDHTVSPTEDWMTELQILLDQWTK